MEGPWHSEEVVPPKVHYAGAGRQFDLSFPIAASSLPRASVVQNPTLSLAGDADATMRVIDVQAEPIILVGDPITLVGDEAEAVFYAPNAPTAGGVQPPVLFDAVKRPHDERPRQKN